MIYLVDRDRMGRFHTGADNHAVATLKAVGEGAFGAPAYWHGHLYYFECNDVLKDFRVENGRLSHAPLHQGSYRFKDPGAIPAVSANGTNDGVVWIVLTKGWQERIALHAAILQAYDAKDVSHMLFSSDNRTEDWLGTPLRFAMTTVAGGRVYVGTKDALYVYGLRAATGMPKPHRKG